MTERDVHTEHCCIWHGCKYGDDDICTVTTHKKTQSYPCEGCEHDSEVLSETRSWGSTYIDFLDSHF